MGLRPVLTLSKCITVDHIQLMLVSTRALKALVLKLNYKYIPWKAQIEEVFFTFFFFSMSVSLGFVSFWNLTKVLLFIQILRVTL